MRPAMHQRGLTDLGLATSPQDPAGPRLAGAQNAGGFVWFLVNRPQVFALVSKGNPVLAVAKACLLASEHTAVKPDSLHRNFVINLDGDVAMAARRVDEIVRSLRDRIGRWRELDARVLLMAAPPAPTSGATGFAHRCRRRLWAGGSSP